MKINDALELTVFKIAVELRKRGRPKREVLAAIDSKELRQIIWGRLHWGATTDEIFERAFSFKKFNSKVKTMTSYVINYLQKGWDLRDLPKLKTRSLKDARVKIDKDGQLIPLGEKRRKIISSHEMRLRIENQRLRKEIAELRREFEVTFGLRRS